MFLIRLAVGPEGSVPTFVAVVDTVAGLVAAVGLTYFAARLIVLAKRRLLWRVRRKLILSYIFIGFVPALLLVAFSLLCGFLLFYNFSSYLVQSRLRALADQARFLAQSTALEIQRAGGRDVASIIARRQANAGSQYPDVSIAVVPVDRVCGWPRTPRRIASNRSPTDRADPRSGRHAIRSRIRVADRRALDAPRSAASAARLDRLCRVLPASSRTRTAGRVAGDGRRIRICSCAASRSLIRRGPATRSSSICSSTTPFRQQLRQDTGVELKTVTAAPPREHDGGAAAARARRRRRTTVPRRPWRRAS